MANQNYWGAGYETQHGKPNFPNELSEAYFFQYHREWCSSSPETRRPLFSCRSLSQMCLQPYRSHYLRSELTLVNRMLISDYIFFRSSELMADVEPQIISPPQQNLCVIRCDVSVLALSHQHFTRKNTYKNMFYGNSA